MGDDSWRLPSYKRWRVEESLSLWWCFQRGPVKVPLTPGYLEHAFLSKESNMVIWLRHIWLLSLSLRFLICLCCFVSGLSPSPSGSTSVSPVFTFSSVCTSFRPLNLPHVTDSVPAVCALTDLKKCTPVVRANKILLVQEHACTDTHTHSTQRGQSYLLVQTWLGS